MKKAFKIFAVLFLIVIMLTCCSCKTRPLTTSSSYTPVLKEYDISPLNYYSVYCPDNKATTEIAINGEKIFCKWLDDNYQEHVSVIENIASQHREWVNITEQDEIDTALTHFKTYDYHPLNEKVGECIVYTDKDNNFYISDVDADITYDLGINLENWRRFSTNGNNMYAFLSCESTLVGRKYMHEVRVYKIEKHLSDSSHINTTLIRRITADDDLNNIGGIRVISSSCTIGAPIINDTSDMKFLQKYTYSHYRTTKKELENQLLKDKTNYSFEVVTKNQSKYFLYLMQDGSIAIQQMCGDSEVSEISYDFYTADKEDMLTKEKLESLTSKEE